MTDIYANISIGHENDWNVLEKRIIAAAHCNADCVVISKSTPHLVIPENKKYVSINTKWGAIPYIEAARRSELSEENVIRIMDFCDEIGIPYLFSVTDSVAAEFIKEVANPKRIKLHRDAIEIYELLRYCKGSFEHVIISDIHLPETPPLYKIPKDNLYITVCVSTDSFPPKLEELNFHRVDELNKHHYNVAYEGREAGIFPAIALAYKNVKWIEKYLGDEGDTSNPSILTPQQFYDFFNSVHIMEQALGSPNK